MDHYSVLFAVRAFYLDIAQWALEDPSWAPWAVRCPVRDSDVRGSMKQSGSPALACTSAPGRSPLPALADCVEDHLGRRSLRCASSAPRTGPSNSRSAQPTTLRVI